MISVTLKSKILDKDGNVRRVSMELPEYDESVFTKAFNRIGACDKNDYDLCFPHCDVFRTDTLHGIDLGHNTIHELNFLAHKMTSLSHDELTDYSDLLSLHKPDNLKDMINLTANLENSILYVSEVKTVKELGELLVDNGFVEIPENVLKYVDYAKIGNEHLKDFTAALTKDGYMEAAVELKDMTEIYDGITLPDIAFTPQQDEDMTPEMGM